VGQSFRERRLFEIAVDLRERMAELQKLREAIKLAEASNSAAIKLTDAVRLVEKVVAVA
jgi:hypothetical protein